MAPYGFVRVDMHCHLDFADNARELATRACADGIGLYSVTVNPEGYERAAALLGAQPNVRVGAGLHPWWVAKALAAMRISPGWKS